MGEEAGMEMPTTDEVGREFGFLREGAEDGVSGRNKDAHDFLTGGGGGGCDSVVRLLCSIETTTDSGGGEKEATLAFPDDVPATETEVLVDCGEPGIDVSGEVEPAGVVSAVADEEVTSRSLGSRSIDTSGGLGSDSVLAEGMAVDGENNDVGECFGDTGGVGRSRAC